MAEQRKRNKEEKRTATKYGRKAGGEQRRQKDKMRSKEVKKFKVQVAKVTNHNHRLTRKLRNKNP